jgi:hypothetical protein
MSVSADMRTNKQQDEPPLGIWKHLHGKHLSMAHPHTPDGSGINTCFRLCMHAKMAKRSLRYIFGSCDAVQNNSSPVC